MKPADVIFFYVRWTTRKVNRCFLRQCKLLLDLGAKSNGHTHLYACGNNTDEVRHNPNICNAFSKVWYMQQTTNTSIVEATRWMIDYSIRYGFKVMVLVDDDAIYRDLNYARQRLAEAFTEMPSLGAAGPYAPFEMAIKYKMRPPKYDAIGEQRCTFGSQAFRVEYLKKSRSRIFAAYDRIQFRHDILMFLLAEEAGWTTCKMDLNFYHRASSGRLHENFTPDQVAEQRQRLEARIPDYDVLADEFPDHAKGIMRLKKQVQRFHITGRALG